MSVQSVEKNKGKMVDTETEEYLTCGGIKMEVIALVALLISLI